MGEFPHEVLQRHSVLQREADQSSDRVHQATYSRALLGHRDEKFARLAIFEQANREVPFVAGDAEFVGEGRARLRHAAAYRLANLLAELFHLLLKCSDLARDGLFFACLVLLPRVERLRAFGSIAVDGDALQAHFPGFHVDVADFQDGGRVGHVHCLGDGPRKEGLRGPHDLQVGQMVQAAFTSCGFEGAIEHRQVFGLESALGDIALLR